MSADAIKLPALAGGEVYGVLHVHHLWALPFLPGLWREHGVDPSGARSRTVLAWFGIFWEPCPELTRAVASLPKLPPDIRYGESLGIGFRSFREE